MSSFYFRRSFLALSTLLALLLGSVDVCRAAKGGKPGGGDPPSPSLPVTYRVTRIAVPQSNTFHGHNQDADLVGTAYNSPLGGTRGLAYIPSFSSDAFILDDPAVGVQGIPTGWHTRRAIDINNLGTIVGNIELDDAPNTVGRPFYLTGLSAGTPELHTLGPFDTDAWNEAAISVNDSGDMVVLSQKRLADDTTIDSLYVGNPGLHGEAAVPFQKIDFAASGLTTPNIWYFNLDITPRAADGKAIITGAVESGDVELPFRVKSDGSSLDWGPLSYVQADGTTLEWRGLQDATDDGTIVGNALALSATKGKVQANGFLAAWAPNSNDELVSATGEPPLQSTYRTGGSTNNDDDYLFYARGQGSELIASLWHSEWSADHGAISIADLIAADDPDRDLFWQPLELTDKAASGWPTIIASGIDSPNRVVDDTTPYYWLLLTPELVSSGQLVTAEVPEPSTAVLLAVAALVCLLKLRKTHRVSVS